MENLDTGNTGFTRQKTQHREPRLLYSELDSS
jgi:hypothetical protein